MRILSVLIALAFIVSCNSFEVIQSDLPGFKELDYEYNIANLDTELSNDVVKLGRVLFYDNILSQNGKVSCASCHQQIHSFGDNKALSIGFLSGETNANTISLINNKFNKTFFWSGFVDDIHKAVTQPIFNFREMGMDVEELINRVHATEYYEPLFKEAFGSDDVSDLLISEALAQFVESLVCTDSRFDKFKNRQLTLSDSEEAGMELFKTQCNDCHNVLEKAYYTGNEDWTTDIGLPSLNGLSQYYSFSAVRVPSLRNIELTAPYMHDGRFDTLLEVIEHYNSGVTTDGRRTGSVDSRLLNISEEPQQLGLTFDEKIAIRDFLLTLTDRSIIMDEKFSSPFAD